MPKTSSTYLLAAAAKQQVILFPKCTIQQHRVYRVVYISVYTHTHTRAHTLLCLSARTLTRRRRCLRLDRNDASAGHHRRHHHHHRHPRHRHRSTPDPPHIYIYITHSHSYPTISTLLNVCTQPFTYVYMYTEHGKTRARDRGERLSHREHARNAHRSRLGRPRHCAPRGRLLRWTLRVDAAKLAHIVRQWEARRRSYCWWWWYRARGRSKKKERE